MKILDLIIKKEYFDKIIKGEKTVEHREIRAKTAYRYIEYIDEAGNVYKKDTDVPEDVTVDVFPVQYDAIRFLVGYNKDRESALVEVKKAEIVIITDKQDNEVIYEYQGREYVEAVMDYHLGRIIR